MIKSLEVKGGESILAIEGIFVRFGKLHFKSYLHPLPDKTLIKWALTHSTDKIQITWNGDYFTTLTDNVKEIHYYTPSGLEGLIRYLAKHGNFIIHHYGDNSVPIVLSRKMRRA